MTTVETNAWHTHWIHCFTISWYISMALMDNGFEDQCRYFLVTGGIIDSRFIPIPYHRFTNRHLFPHVLTSSFPPFQCHLQVRTLQEDGT